jgi:hypothetical protein
VGHAGMSRVREVFRLVIIRRGFRGEIGADRILSHAKDRIDVRGHMQRVKCVRRDLVVELGRRHAYIHSHPRCLVAGARGDDSRNLWCPFMI